MACCKILYTTYLKIVLQVYGSLSYIFAATKPLEFVFDTV